jgi:hypothetical protein
VVLQLSRALSKGSEHIAIPAVRKPVITIRVLADI